MTALEDLGFQSLCKGSSDSTGAASASSREPWIVLLGSVLTLGVGAVVSRALDDLSAEEFVRRVAHLPRSMPLKPETAKAYAELLERQIRARQFANHPHAPLTTGLLWPQCYKVPYKELVDELLEFDPELLEAAIEVDNGELNYSINNHLEPRRFLRGEISKLVERAKRLPIHTLKEALIPPGMWLQWESAREVTRRDVALVASLIEDSGRSPYVISLLVPTLRQTLSGESFASPASESFHLQKRARGIRLLRDQGLLKKFCKLYSGKTVAGMLDQNGDFTHMASELSLLPEDHVPSKWSTPAELKEELDKIFIKQGGSEDRGGEPDPVARARDKVASKDWDWAISEYPQEYLRGKRLAPVMKGVVDQLADLNKSGETLLIHGRDGELLYEMLKRRPDVDMSKVRYAITSRGLTSLAADVKAKAKEDAKDPKNAKTYDAHVYARREQQFEDYLKQIPADAIHIDTGFQGSIPRYLADQKGVRVKRIAMISAEKPEEQLDVDRSLVPDYGLRTMVLTDLEHSPQRLNKPDIRTWGQTGYSPNAPGFWARLAGMLGFKKKE